MFIARKLKKENIVEYLLYMWQIEDLIRAFGLNIDAVEERIIKPFPVKEEAERKELYEWYESLIEMMRLENVQEKGHLQLNKNIIVELDDFHSLIMGSGVCFRSPCLLIGDGRESFFERWTYRQRQSSHPVARLLYL
jgi:hypothetical protein